MNANAPARGTPEGDTDRLEVLGAFIWQERERVHAAAGLQPEAAGAKRSVECRLRGASMATAIPAGSRIRITFGRQPRRVGDIVAFMTGERIVVHRIVHVGRREVITRGDAMLLPDPPFAPEAVLGTVDEIDSGDGWRRPGAQAVAPRRDRLLAHAVLVASGLLLRLDAGLARRFVEWLDAADHRFAWTRKLLLY